MSRVPPPEHSRFKPGQSGNISGRPKLPPELRAIAELTVDEIKRTIAKYGRMSAAQVQDVIENPATTMIELYIATIFATGAKVGDYAKLAFILDRSIGRPAPDAALSNGTDVIPIAYLPKSLREDAKKNVEPVSLPSEEKTDGDQDGSERGITTSARVPV